MAPQALVCVTFDPLISSWTHTLHMARARQRAGFRVYTVMVTDVCHGKNTQKNLVNVSLEFGRKLPSVLSAGLIGLLQSFNES